MQALFLKGNVATVRLADLVQRIVEQVDGFTQFILARVPNLVSVGAAPGGVLEV